MVRLKVISIMCPSQKYIISIPYGAIKSYISKRRVFYLHHISIPYGAIKRQSDEIRIYADYYISIPYGAIKSPSVIKATPFLSLFQFLMVRLKGAGKVLA